MSIRLKSVGSYEINLEDRLSAWFRMNLEMEYPDWRQIIANRVA